MLCDFYIIFAEWICAIFIIRYSLYWRGLKKMRSKAAMLLYEKKMSIYPLVIDILVNLDRYKSAYSLADLPIKKQNTRHQYFGHCFKPKNLT